ncbi:MAG TPA: DUF559 domain-containing protein, partial [Solirubrobacteraceae bacterium]|nr:DUF559 domain-containing protein [Solirubrobacteraceae bacterium]
MAGHAQLEALGVSARAVERRLAAARLRPLHRGVYLVGHSPPTLHARWMAAVLACGPDALLSHTDAAALWGLRPPGSGDIHVTVPRRSARRHEGIRIHRPRRLDPDDVAGQDGIPCTSWPRTLLDCATTLPPHQLARAVERADDQQLWDTIKLDALLTSHPNHPGARRLRRALAEHRPGTVTDSDLEARFHHLCRQAGIPRPLTNAWLQLRDGRWIRPDARWPDHHLIVEVDGYDVHRRRRTFRSDRVRDADLQELGYVVVRVTEEDLDEPAAVLARLRRLLYT